MANTRANLIEASKKAVLSPRIGKHGPWLKTLEANKQRERYLEKIAEHFDEIAEVQIKSAKDRFEGEKDRKEIIHQFVGKPVERIEVHSVSLKIDL